MTDKNYMLPDDKKYTLRREDNSWILACVHGDLIFSMGHPIEQYFLGRVIGLLNREAAESERWKRSAVELRRTLKQISSLHKGLHYLAQNQLDSDGAINE